MTQLISCNTRQCFNNILYLTSIILDSDKFDDESDHPI